MNLETGEIKDLASLTPEEKKDPNWQPLPSGLSASEIQKLQSLGARSRRRMLKTLTRKYSKLGIDINHSIAAPEKK